MTTKLKERAREWLLRYGPAEVFSLAATLGAALAVHRTGGRPVTVALAAVWAGNVAYFGLILCRDVLETQRQLRAQGRRYTGATLGRNVAALLVEFGAAEVLDSFLVRPALMYWMPRWLGSLGWGITVAKFAADVTFYVPAILSYELGARRLRRSWLHGATPEGRSAESKTSDGHQAHRPPEGAPTRFGGDRTS